MGEPFKKSTAREYFETIAIAVVLALFIRTWVVQAFKIPTGSMENNLLIGDHLLVNKFVFNPLLTGDEFLTPTGEVQRGDILVFKFPEDPERDFIKRVIGLPGETLEVRASQVFIDGHAIEEPYLEDQKPSFGSGGLAMDRRDNYGPIAIPDAHYFMMGDNRDNSQDSRIIGPVPIKNLVGRAEFLWFSIDGAFLEFWKWPWTIRFERLFDGIE